MSDSTSRKWRKLIAFSFASAGLFVICYFLLNNQISVSFETYFKPEYYLKFANVVISVVLINGAVLLYKGHDRTNFVLAVFGYMIIEEVFFDIIGVTVSYSSLLTSIVLLVFAIPALWIAHSNAFQTKPISKLALLGSVAIGTAESLLPLIVT